jgi:hypothetical protein
MLLILPERLQGLNPRIKSKSGFRAVGAWVIGGEEVSKSNNC